MADHSASSSEEPQVALEVEPLVEPEMPAYSGEFNSAPFESPEQIPVYGENAQAPETPSWQSQTPADESFQYQTESVQDETPSFGQQGAADYNHIESQFDPNSSAAPEVEEPAYDFSQTLDAVPTPVQEPQDSLAEITSFANTEANGSGFSYDISIKGLDSALTVKLFREAITDSRFTWNEEEVMGQIVKGQLILKGIAPVKAAILINRIKYLELNISWSQSVYG